MLLSFLFYSCVNDYYFINLSNYNETTLRGKRINDWQKTNKLTDDVFRLDKSAISSIKLFGTNQFYSEFIFEIMEGGNLNLYFRTSENDFYNDSYIKISLQKDKVELYEDRNLISRLNYSLSINELYSVKYRQEGSRFSFIIDCDTLFQNKTQLPLSEYIIFETDSKTTAKISSLKMKDIFYLNSF